jgi:hypothetical protein
VSELAPAPLSAASVEGRNRQRCRVLAQREPSLPARRPRRVPPDPTAAAAHLGRQLSNVLTANDLAFLEEQSSDDPAERKSGRRHAPIDAHDFIVAFPLFPTQSTYLVLHILEFRLA